MSVIGISFGNTSSSIAAANNEGKVDVIANPDGDRSIPSSLSYVGDDEYHGQQAQAQLIRHPKNTIINFRDLIGSEFDDVNTDLTKNGSPAIKLEDGTIGFKVEAQTISVEEATKRHLKQLKVAAEDYIGKPVEGCVITVPTNFSDVQRTKLVEASNSIGLKVHQLINEPSSALLAYLSNNEEEYLNDKIFVVADFGGVRSDGAVISVRGGILTILTTLHDSHLGGDNFDEALMEFFAKDFEKKFKTNPRNNARSLAKLKNEAIVVKKTLSNVATSSVSIESLADGYDYQSSINRLRYELTIRPIVTKMTQFVEKLVEKANLLPSEINEVLLVGGSSNTPKLSSELAALFPESTTKIISPVFDSKALLPNELVCRGAALQAALIESFDDDEIKESLQPIVVNTQHLINSIGIKSQDGKFVPIVVNETAYPIKKSLEVTNGEADSVVIDFYEGKKTVKETVIEPTKAVDSDGEEYSDDSDEEEPEIIKEVIEECGEQLGSLSLKDLKPNSKLEIGINITQDGKLHLSARELKLGSVATKIELSFK